MKIFELAGHLASLNEKKAHIEAELKEVKKEIESTNEQLVELMVDEEVQRFSRDGTLFYLQTDVYVSDVADRREVFYEALRQQGHGDLIRETVHPQTLKAFTKEQMTDDLQLPEWLEGLVTVFRKDKVRLRKES